ncbi:MAG: UvrD-helicase domain-containing protein [Deltaproteobacteria bacterium]|nr:UvrD-helicase domain-containing protein [Deltaproteobacteria bacterium]
MEQKQHLQDLNPQQLEAVSHGEGPLLIFAGAGSGKTRVLTRRIANLVIEHGVSPGEIFAVTFTNKAANEMKHRVCSLFSTSGNNLWVSTFHSSCARLLRSHAELLDFTPNFAIYDASDALSLLKRVYKKLNIDPKIVDPRQVAHRIDRAKNQYMFPDDLISDKYTPRPIAELTATIYRQYQKELLSANAMDFGDLICNVVTLFKLEPTLLQQYQNKFRHILIDEYQDTNKVQYLLIRMLAEKHQNICVVGDDDQSIYAFRGATIENILNFRKDFPNAKVVTLENNYRSTQNILKAANAVIARNRTRQKKTLRTTNPAGKAVSFSTSYDEVEEANFVTREILTLRRQGLPISEIAIFYRTNAQSRAVEEMLIANNIPYEIYGGHKFYDRKEIKDIMAYFRLTLNPNDNEAFLRIVNTPTRGLGATSVSALILFANNLNLSLYNALEKAITDGAPFLNNSSRIKFSAFFELLAELKEDSIRTDKILSTTSNSHSHDSKIQAMAKFLHDIAIKTSYIQSLKNEDTPEAEARLENISELCNVGAEFVKTALMENVDVRLNHFIDRTSLASDLDKENTKAQQIRGQEKPKEHVSLMTLHLAKGLEFDVVFMLGMEEGLLPHIRSLASDHEVEEERRLCYVGMTRARKQLYMTRAKSRQTFGRGNWGYTDVSRFVEDLPTDVVRGSIY